MVVGLSFVSGQAHHAVSEIYDVNQTRQIEGSVGRVLYQGPHVVVPLEVMNENGRFRTWTVELESATKLNQEEMTREIVRPGDRLTVCGHPGRDASLCRMPYVGIGTKVWRV